MTQRQFKGIWIPAHIWEELSLTCAERCLWAEIDSFTRGDSAYYKTNEQAAEELGVSERTISRAFAKLENLGAITIEQTPRRRVARSTPWRDGVDKCGGAGRHDGEAGSPQWRGHIKKKEKNTHNTSNNKGGLILPFEENEFLEAWETWKKERRNIVKGQYTERAQQLGANKLATLSRGDMQRAIDIINQSIEYGWKGFFPIREERGKNRPALDASAALKWANQ